MNASQVVCRRASAYSSEFVAMVVINARAALATALWRTKPMRYFFLALEPIAEPRVLRPLACYLVERARGQLDGTLVFLSEAPKIGSQLPVPGRRSVSSRSPSRLRWCVLPVGSSIPPMERDAGTLVVQ